MVEFFSRFKFFFGNLSVFTEKMDYRTTVKSTELLKLPDNVDLIKRKFSIGCENGQKISFTLSD